MKKETNSILKNLVIRTFEPATSELSHASTYIITVLVLDKTEGFSSYKVHDH